MKTSARIKNSQPAIQTQATHSAPQLYQQLLNRKQLSEILNIGIRALARLHASGKMPKALHIGGAVRWNAKTILDWLEAGAPDLRKKGGVA